MLKRKWFRVTIQTFLVLIMLSTLGYIGYKGYQRYIMSHLNAHITSEEFFPYNIPTTPSVEDVVRARTSISGFYGLVASENLELNVPVWRGLSDYALYRGGALERQDMEFGKGHIVMFGHNVVDKYLFGNLSKLGLGTKVYMYQGSVVYVYEVYESRVGKDTESDYVNKGLDGYDTCTLVTCIGSYPTEDRYFVKVRLVGLFSDKDSIDKVKGKFNWG